jgi:hypothetical protein
MLSEIISNLPMDKDIETDWISVRYNIKNGLDLSASSIQIIWSEVEGSLDGYIDMMVTNNLDYQTLGGRFYVNFNSNVDDALIIVIIPGFDYLKLKYVSNGTTKGLLTASISYSKIW